MSASSDIEQKPQARSIINAKIQFNIYKMYIVDLGTFLNILSTPHSSSTVFEVQRFRRTPAIVLKSDRSYIYIYN